MSRLKIKNSLNAKDKEFILTYYNVLTPSEIAIKRGVDIRAVKKFIIKNVGHVKFEEEGIQPLEEDSEKNELKEIFEIKEQLKSRPEYLQLKDELSPDEIKFFEYRYAQLIAQFKEDILASEIIQVFKSIKFEILIQRAMKAQKIIELSLSNISKNIDVLSKNIQDDQASNEEKERLVRLTEQTTALRQAQSYKIKEVRELNKEHEQLLVSLKASREQRINRIENSKMTFLELIKQLHDDEFREREGRLAGLAELAAKKEEERLSKLHTYMDNTIDSPLLSYQTVDM